MRNTSPVLFAPVVFRALAPMIAGILALMATIVTASSSACPWAVRVFANYLLNRRVAYSGALR